MSRGPRTQARILELERVYDNLEFNQPVQMTLSPTRGHWYVAEKAGRVWRVAVADPSESELVLDLSSRVRSDRTLGLLGLALHPNFAVNGQMYLSYTATGHPRPRNTLARSERRFRSQL